MSVMESGEIGQPLAFGPIPSRRLGLSVGVNVVPRKVCSFNCVYCQLGRTTQLTLERRGYVRTESVVEAVRCKLADAIGTDFVTVLGDGEPTLASNLGEVLDGIAEVWDGRTALLTNGSMLWVDEVREVAAEFDAVMPTLSSYDQESFRSLHRPHGSLSFGTYVDGLREFVIRNRGTTWLELMLVKGVNDDAESLMRIGAIIDEMKPAEVHLMVPTRPPSSSWVEPPARRSIDLALELIPGSIDFTLPERTEMPGSRADPVRHLVDISGTHPLRHGQAISVLLNAGLATDAAAEEIRRLVDASVLVALDRYGETYYVRGHAADAAARHV